MLRNSSRCLSVSSISMMCPMLQLTAAQDVVPDRRRCANESSRAGSGMRDRH
jgi:hypothetical protein